MRSTDTFDATVQAFGKSRPFRLFDTRMSRTVCDEIFNKRHYPLVDLREDVNTVIDIGANIGCATVLFGMAYPHATVYAFEPSPRAFPLLQYNTHGMRNVRTFNAALSNEDGHVPLFHGMDDPSTDSLFKSSLCSDSNSEVIVQDAFAMISDLGIGAIDILKLDTEGCEIPILSSLFPCLEDIGVLYVEYHSESDRRAIDLLMPGSHLLWSGSCDRPHRGELCYVKESWLKSHDKDLEITRQAQAV